VAGKACKAVKLAGMRHYLMAHMAKWQRGKLGAKEIYCRKALCGSILRGRGEKCFAFGMGIAVKTIATEATACHAIASATAGAQGGLKRPDACDQKVSSRYPPCLGPFVVSVVSVVVWFVSIPIPIAIPTPMCLLRNEPNLS